MRIKDQIALARQSSFTRNKWTAEARAKAWAARHVNLVGTKNNLHHYFQMDHPGAKIVSMLSLKSTKFLKEPKSIRNAEGAMQRSLA